MSALSVRVVGVGDAFTARYHNACLLFDSGSTRLLVDAPPALARALRDLSLARPDEPPVGLDQLLFWRRFVTGKKANRYAVPEVLAGLWDTRLRGGMETLIDTPGGPPR